MLCAVLVLVTAQHECPRLPGVRYGLAGLGDTCGSSEECMNYAVTEGSGLEKRICYDNRCRRLLEEGMRCTMHTECLGGACVAVDSVSLQARRFTCTASGTFAEGSFCTDDIYCRTDLFCKEGQCARRPLGGDVCYVAQGNKTYTCAEGSTCVVPLVSTVQTAVCTTLDEVGTTGVSCSKVVRCSHEHYCRKLSTSHTCQPLKTTEACSSDSECQAGHGCNQNMCILYFSIAAGGAAERNVFCRLGLHAFNSRCTEPLNIDTPCSSDTDCSAPQDGGLLACSCMSGTTGTCSYILPDACHAQAQAYIAHEDSKYTGERLYENLQREYFCCLRGNIAEQSAAWYLSSLGRHDTSGLDCDDDSVPAWIIIVVVLAVVICCLILLVTSKLLMGGDKEESSKKKQEPVPEPVPPGPLVPPTPALETPVRKERTEPDPNTKELEAELKNLSALKSYKAKDPGGHAQVQQKPFCEDFTNCKLLGEAEHRATYMHQCMERSCPDALNAAHCTYYWHIRPSCLDPECADPDSTHFLKNRHYCQQSVNCRDLSDPVHQQLFRHVSRENPLLTFNRM